MKIFKTALLSIALIPLLADTNYRELEKIYKLPDLVVTSSIWNVPEYETAQSVSIISNESIENLSFEHFQDLTGSIPNLTWTAGTSRPSHIQIRGIGENSQYEGETPDSSVRFYIDDLDFTGLGAVGNLFDIDQVEVLRGAQAGSYGINASGGIIKIKSNDPTPFWTGKLQSTIGENSLISNGFAFGGPLIDSTPDKLTFRLSTQKTDSNGFINNTNLNRNDTNNINEFTSRLKFFYNFTDLIQIQTNLFYANSNNGYDEWNINGTHNFTTETNTPGEDNLEAYAANFKTIINNYKDFKITSNSSITKSLHYNSYDGDFTDREGPEVFVDDNNNGIWDEGEGLTEQNFNDDHDEDPNDFAFTNRKRTRFNQELKFDYKPEIDKIIRTSNGLYYNHLDEINNFNWTTNNDFVRKVSDSFTTNLKTKSFGLFGKTKFYLKDKHTLDIGYNSERYLTSALVPTSINKINISDTLYGGNITYYFNKNKNTILFASVNRGYKAGGVNIYPDLYGEIKDSVTQNQILPSTYNPEKLINYEIGLKTKSTDSKFDLKATLFNTTRTNVQLRDSAGRGVHYVYYTLNGDKAKHIGSEISSRWHINKKFKLDLNIGFLYTSRNSYYDPLRTYTPYTYESNGDDGIVDKRELSNAPTYTLNSRLNYFNKGFYATLEANIIDSYYNINSNDERRSQSTVFNSSIGYEISRNLSIQIWGKNIFDKRYEKLVFYNVFGGENRYENYADPANFGLTIKYNW